MLTLAQQIEYYNSLSDSDKGILNAFVIKTLFTNYNDLRSLIPTSKKYNAKIVNVAIEDSLEKGILLRISHGELSYAGKYYVSYPFLAYIISRFTDYGKERFKKRSNYFTYGLFFNSVDPRDVAQMLFDLLYESKFNNNKYNDILDDDRVLLQLDLLNTPVYKDNINKFDATNLSKIVYAEMYKTISTLESIDKVDKIRTIFLSKVDEDKISTLNSWYVYRSIYKGEFSKVLSVLSDESNLGVTVDAILKTLNGDANNALKLYDQSIKMYRKEKEYKGIQILPLYYFNYFYFALLLSLPIDKVSARVKKILANIDKFEYISFAHYYKFLLEDMLGIRVDNNKGRKEAESFRQLLLQNIANENDFSTLFKIAFAYLADITPPQSMKNHIVRLVEKGHHGGYNLMAYEAAYAAYKWFGDEQCTNLYRKIEKDMGYKPAASKVLRVEQWEKSLDLMVGALGGIGNKNDDNDNNSDSRYRIVYVYYPEINLFKPILQTLGANGRWSKGRNVSVKSFQEGKTKGMTDKDLKISKYVRSYRDWGSDVYELSHDVAEELIGYPLVFMGDNIDIPIEFVAAKPTIKVQKKRDGYQLQSNIKKYDSSLIISKETNTRYLVYKLDTKMQELLRILTTSGVVIPEKGKEKLIPLLGEISKHALVQSDLLATDQNGGIEVKDVETDSRIRVQLLPIGDGLKAELFVKPFDKVPPYAKPASGGKVLITNVEGKQLQVKRNFSAERENYYAIVEDIQSLEGVDMTNDLISFEDPLDSLYLLDVISEHHDICVVEWPEGEKLRIRSKADFTNLKMNVKSKTNWFELEGELKIDENTVLSIQELLGLMNNSHDRFIELKKGEFIALSEELRKRLMELHSVAGKSKNGVKLNKYASLALDGLFDNLEDLKTDKTWKDFRKRVNSKSIRDSELPTNLQADLRPYQEEGYRWMMRLAEMGAGACLADDMGLGKTLQTLAMLLKRMDKGPALVVCPVSIVGNWIAEAQRFAPMLNMQILNSNDRDKTIKDLTEGDVLVTSYGLLQSEEELFAKKEFATIVLDEAHIIKNYATKTSKAIMNLKGDFRLALTGTPLQNHMGEIWNLFNFINPGLLGSLKHFADTYIKPGDDASKKLLRKLIRPFILRRTKSAVLDELPPKTEIIKKIKLSDTEMAFYEALRRQAIHNMEVGDDRSGAKHLKALAEITKLRQASCNPLLVDANIGIESSKLNAFLEIVEELRENKHRALVFSQFVSHLAIVRRALDELGIKYQYLDGSSPMNEREQSVKKFQKGDGDLFLISLKAGGLGLNLTAADFVIHLDPWWNPAIEDQASDRAHRFGQTRPVTIYRLVAENTIEEKILKLHSTKRDLAETLLEGTDQSAKLSFNELIGLIADV